MTEVSKTADNALAVLSALAEGGPNSPQALARSLGLNRTVVQRLLITLHNRGFVVREDGEYLPSLLLRHLSNSVFGHLRTAAEPILASLATSTAATAVLGVLDDQDWTVIAQAVPAASLGLHIRHEIGFRSPLTTGASGKVLLAFSLPRTITKVLAKQTAADSNSVRAELKQIAVDGYSHTRDELISGVNAIAVPVRNSQSVVTASLALLVPSTRGDDLDALLPTLLKASKQLNKQLHETE
ncbi:IclR family transcriptional regulator [Arthrobacter sp. Cr_A7]|uniref:IclR family transcriptional regulator n=1 Tax=Arthrobacter sp. Cr_A7 TaxID=3031017 RepID=UPI0023DA63D5|nr:IclR family transcriptional regulator [Arthrobacter sp. Cr_A7]MDF2050428.1 IclR family transcriptional regulator [Arthrobacter sp. Cr_A7]